MKYLEESEEVFFEDSIKKRMNFEKLMVKINDKIGEFLDDIFIKGNSADTICWSGGGRSWRSFFDCSIVPEVEQLSLLENISIVSGNYDIFLVSNQKEEFKTLFGEIINVFNAIVSDLSSSNDLGTAFTFKVVYPKTGSKPSPLRMLNTNEMCALFKCTNIAITISNKTKLRNASFPEDDIYKDVYEDKHIVYMECAYIENINIKQFRDELLTDQCTRTGAVLPHYIPSTVGFLVFSEFILTNRSTDKGGINVDNYRKIILDKIIKLPSLTGLFVMIDNQTPIQNDILKSIDKILGDHIYLKVIILSTIIAYGNIDQMTKAIFERTFQQLMAGFQFNITQQNVINSICIRKNNNLELHISTIHSYVDSLYTEINKERTEKVIITAIRAYYNIFKKLTDGAPKGPIYNKTIISNIAMNLLPKNITEKFLNNLMERLRPFLNTTIPDINSYFNKLGLFPNKAFIFVAGGDSMRRYQGDISKTSDIDTKCFYISKNNDDKKTILNIVIQRLFMMVTLLNAVNKNIFSRDPEFEFESQLSYTYEQMPISVNIKIPYIREGMNQYRLRYILKSQTFPVDLLSIDYRTTLRLQITIGPHKLQITRPYNVAILDVPLIPKITMPDFESCVNITSIANRNFPVYVANLPFLIDDIEHMYTDRNMTASRISGGKRDKDKKRIEDLKILQTSNTYNSEFDRTIDFSVGSDVQKAIVANNVEEKYKTGSDAFIKALEKKSIKKHQTHFEVSQAAAAQLLKDDADDDLSLLTHMLKMDED